MEENKYKNEEYAGIIIGILRTILAFTKFVFLIYAILALQKYLGG